METKTEYDNKLTRLLAIVVMLLFVGLSTMAIYLGITPLLSLIIAFACVILLIIALPKKWFLHEKV